MLIELAQNSPHFLEALRQWRYYLAENESSLLKRKDLFAYFYGLSFRKDKNKLGDFFSTIISVK